MDLSRLPGYKYNQIAELQELRAGESAGAGDIQSQYSIPTLEKYLQEVTGEKDIKINDFAQLSDGQKDPGLTWINEEFLNTLKNQNPGEISKLIQTQIEENDLTNEFERISSEDQNNNDGIAISTDAFKLSNFDLKTASANPVTPVSNIDEFNTTSISLGENFQFPDVSTYFNGASLPGNFATPSITSPYQSSPINYLDVDQGLINSSGSGGIVQEFAGKIDDQGFYNLTGTGDAKESITAEIGKVDSAIGQVDSSYDNMRNAIGNQLAQEYNTGRNEKIQSDYGDKTQGKLEDLLKNIGDMAGKKIPEAQKAETQKVKDTYGGVTAEDDKANCEKFTGEHASIASTKGVTKEQLEGVLNGDTNNIGTLQGKSKFAETAKKTVETDKKTAEGDQQQAQKDYEAAIAAEEYGAAQEAQDRVIAAGQQMQKAKQEIKEAEAEIKRTEEAITYLDAQKANIDGQITAKTGKRTTELEAIKKGTNSTVAAAQKAKDGEKKDTDEKTKDKLDKISKGDLDGIEAPKNNEIKDPAKFAKLKSCLDTLATNKPEVIAALKRLKGELEKARDKQQSGAGGGAQAADLAGKEGANQANPQGAGIAGASSAGVSQGAVSAGNQVNAVSPSGATSGTDLTAKTGINNTLKVGGEEYKFAEIKSELTKAAGTLTADSQLATLAVSSMANSGASSSVNIPQAPQVPNFQIMDTTSMFSA